jgi:hypothetical protein
VSASALRPLRDRVRRPGRAAVLAGAIGGVLLLAYVVIATFALQFTTRLAWDEHALIQIVERARAYDLPYYVAGADNKGPLWMAPYDIAQHLGNTYTLWWFIALQIVLVALLTCTALFRVGANAGPARLPLLGVAAAVAVWMLFSPAEWSHTLLSRNLIALWWATAFAALTALPLVTAPRLRAALAATGGALAGFAVQTNPSSAPTALVMLGLVAWLSWRGPLRATPRVLGVPTLVAWFAGTALVAFGSAFAWYAVRGDGALHEFWYWWWGYSRTYSQATGRSLPDILWKGVEFYFSYYRTNTIETLVLAAFVVDTVRRGRAREPVWLDVALLAYWLAECVAVSLGQRFFPHYLVLNVVPVALMGAVLASRWGGRLSRPAQAVLATLLIGGAVLSPAWDEIRHGVRAAEAFHGTEQSQREIRDAVPPDRRQVREIIHQIVPNRRPTAVIWTGMPFDYTDFDVRSATRYVVRVWLTGEVYGGGTSLENIPDGAWDRWVQDMRRTPADVIVFHPADPLPPGTAIDSVAACGYKVAFSSPDWTVLGRVRDLKPCLDAL